MLHDTFRELFTLTKNLSTATQRKMIVIGLCIALISILIAACGTSTTAVQTTPTPTPTQVLIPTPSPTLAPTPKPTLTPTPTPKAVQPAVATPTPTPVTASPAELELRPMGLSGHADCTKTSAGGFVCEVVVSSLASAQSKLHWFATTNLSGIGFSPAGSVLGPGQSVLVRISVPAGVCGPGLFFFHGPINTHSTSWVC